MQCANIVSAPSDLIWFYLIFIVEIMTHICNKIFLHNSTMLIITTLITKHMTKLISIGQRYTMSEYSLARLTPSLIHTTSTGHAHNACYTRGRMMLWINTPPSPPPQPSTPNPWFVHETDAGLVWLQINEIPINVEWVVQLMLPSCW